jgi:hypothetical protein
MSNWHLIGRQEFDYRQRIDFLFCCVVGLFVVSITEGVWKVEECNNLILMKHGRDDGHKNMEGGGEGRRTEAGLHNFWAPGRPDIYILYG